ncbi:MAG: DUF2807 domain-containing protein [Methanobacterium sp.]|uniref:GIN domain-containing protein n=1 Tax=Methanobacterium sp. TaxID=2164 RepID=UPI003D6466E6|nr:DUF2807 domain-containing protein [Methanobacterium sp.]
MRDISGFNQIIASGDGPTDIHINQSDKESLEVEAGPYATPSVKTEVKDGKLYLHSSHPVTYYITVKDLNSIQLNDTGPGELKAENLKVTNLNIYTNSMSINLVNLKADKLVFTGSESIDISGEVNEQNINIEQNNEYNGTNLISKIANVNVENNGMATVRVSDVLNAIVKHNGAIYYIGKPQLKKQIDHPSVGRIEEIKG